jgi:hypothetical protein
MTTQKAKAAQHRLNWGISALKLHQWKLNATMINKNSGLHENEISHKNTRFVGERSSKMKT